MQIDGCFLRPHGSNVIYEQNERSNSSWRGWSIDSMWYNNVTPLNTLLTFYAIQASYSLFIFTAFAYFHRSNCCMFTNLVIFHWCSSLVLKKCQVVFHLFNRDNLEQTTSCVTCFISNTVIHLLNTWNIIIHHIIKLQLCCFNYGTECSRKIFRLNFGCVDSNNDIVFKTMLILSKLFNCYTKLFRRFYIFITFFYHAII